MRVLNIRHGFATNSSSCHAVVLLSGNRTWEKVDVISKKNALTLLRQGVEETLDDINGSAKIYNTYSEFSDRLKALDDVRDKTRVRLDCLARDLDVPSWMSWREEGSNDDDDDSMYGYNTTMFVPKNFRGDDVSEGFIRDLIAFLGRDDVGVCSAENADYSKETQELIQQGPSWLHILNELGSGFLARYNTQGKFWTLFSPLNGYKVRLSFDTEAQGLKADTPELVDVKITDYCKAGCRYCYQGSTTKGKHAKLDDIQRIAEALGELEVFEAAIGGGEPTSHPDFMTILRVFNSCGVKPNFSTRNMPWVLEHCEELAKLVGGIGLSIDKLETLGDVRNIARSWYTSHRWGNGLLIQVAVGSMSQGDTVELLRRARDLGVGVLFLGWKTVGRGDCGPQHEVNLTRALESFIDKDHIDCWVGPRVSFDTALAVKHQTWLEKHSNRWYFTLEEGAHSMYIDAVLGVQARSSYGGECESLDMSSTGTVNQQVSRFFKSLT